MQIEKNDVFLITGGTGFLGKAVTKVLRDTYPGNSIYSVGRNYGDLRYHYNWEELLRYAKPTIIIHLAGKVGGIFDNLKKPADYFMENMLINTNLFEMIKDRIHPKIKKVVTVMGGCSYPANAKSPISEKNMWDGYPQKESAAYSLSKKMLLAMSEAYRKQYDINSIVLIPGNMYGPNDDFSESGHIIPAIIRRAFETSKKEGKQLTAYGTGNVSRDFVYVDDVAATFPFFIENYDSSDPVNISSGKETLIKNAVRTICDLIDEDIRVWWDYLKPDGQKVKIFDVTKLNELGLSCDTPFEEGLKKTVDFYRESLK
jgi:GDP-L-fucose synthase